MLESASDIELQTHFDACEERIGYRFQDRDLLRAALTHASAADTRAESNERLEFLGDAILGAVVCEMLYLQFPDFLEGDLTKLKSAVVSRQTCARISQSLKLDDFLIVGKGMAASPKVPNSLLADVFEALIAGVFLDGGNTPAREFIKRFMEPEIKSASEGETGNFKSQLQQLAQREHGSTPVYQLLDEKGPDHSKCFKVSAQIAGNRYSAAWGRNKKEAEQRAAFNALTELGGEDAPYPAED